MKPTYMLFGFDQHCQGGGTDDFLDFFESLENISKYISESSYRWERYLVLDLDNFYVYLVNNTEGRADEMKFVVTRRLK